MTKSGGADSVVQRTLTVFQTYSYVIEEQRSTILHSKVSESNVLYDRITDTIYLFFLEHVLYFQDISVSFAMH